jgi:pimeloyl-ACP methyl ester carboxylesterase
VERTFVALEAWRAGGGSFEHNGHRIFTRRGVAPNAPALLLIHGFPTASWDWSPIWSDVGEKWQAFTLDMLGFGFSAKPHPHDYRIAAQADLCEAFLESQGVGKYHVLAHDYGDTVAQELLARSTEPRSGPQLQSICFLNGGLFPESHSPLPIQKLLASPLGPALARLTSRRRFDASMQRIFGPRTQPAPADLDAFWNLVRADNGLRVIPHVIQYMKERREQRERWVGALQKTSVPLKLIEGTADPIAGASISKRYRQLVPNPDVTELAGIGHYPQVEAPEAVLRAFSAFHARLGTFV